MKKHFKIALTIVSLSTCLAVSSAVFAATSTLTMEKAKQIGQNYLPAGSTFLHGENDYFDYELKYYNQQTLETFEIDINKQTQEITKFESEKQNHIGSTKVTLTENDIKTAVEKETGTGTVFSTYIDVDDGLKKYNALFIKDNYFGKYEVNPENGNILDRSIEQMNPSSQKDSSLTIARVEELAEQNVPGGNITDIDISTYNTIKVLELDIQKDNFAYELKLNAATGEILSSDKEYHANHSFAFQNTSALPAANTNTTTSQTYLSIDKAKEIALQLAPGAVITDIDFDYEHGMAIYEGEMRNGFMEYEFEMNAATGEILKWSSEYDD